MPIDSFFRALAADCGDRALGVVCRVRIGWDAGSGHQGRRWRHLAQEYGPRSSTVMAARAIAAGGGILCCRRRIARNGGHCARFSRPDRPGEATDRPGIRSWPEYYGWSQRHRWTSRTTGTAPGRRIKRRAAIRGFQTLEDYSRSSSTIAGSRALCETVSSPSRRSSGTRRSSRNSKRRCSRRWSRTEFPEIPYGSGCRVRHGRRGLFGCYLPDGISGRRESEDSVRDFRHRYQRNGHRKSPRRHLHGLRAGTCLAAAVERFFTRTERKCQIATAIRDVCVFATQRSADPPSPGWTSSVAVTC